MSVNHRARFATLIGVVAALAWINDEPAPLGDWEYEHLALADVPALRFDAPVTIVLGRTTDESPGKVASVLATADRFVIADARTIRQFSRSGELMLSAPFGARLTPELRSPEGLAMLNGELYVADMDEEQGLSKVHADGTITHVGAVASSASQ